jgi:penicillin-binding protein 2
MYLSRDSQRPPMTAQFSVRVAILGGIALVGFVLIFFRLWYLEVLSTADFVERANNNRIREVAVTAPRGDILDRNGKVLVDNRTALALQVRPDRLPENEGERERVLEELADVAGMRPERVARLVRSQAAELPASPLTLKRDVPDEVVFYLREHQEEFPGVSVDRVFVRRYKQGPLAAHLFGHVREVSEEQLAQPRYQALSPGDEIGQAGLELQYDSLLRGRSGATRIQVDALGRPIGDPLLARPAASGNDLLLTLDTPLQRAGEAALGSFGLPGAFVAMDVDSGAILAMGSTPTFDPSIYTKVPLRERDIEELYSTDRESPQSNRAIQGLYPTGSTFKLVTAVAALEEGLITPSSLISDPGTLEIGGTTFANAGDPPPAYGTLNLPLALQVSSDVFFYTLGLRAGQEGNEAIQDWARDLGFGEPTGIDLPAELGGLVPTPEWRDELYREGLTDRPWLIGDNINLSVGQGDLQADPLQLAVAYAALANGGDVVRPHLGSVVEDQAGRTIQEIRPAPRRHLEIAPTSQEAILEGMRLAAMEPTGTSFETFGGFPIEIAGKTGTAERGFYDSGAPFPDQSWYVALVPAVDPEIVIALTIERGGFGADAAAPAVAEIVAKYLNLRPRDIAKVAAPAPPGSDGEPGEGGDTAAGGGGDASGDGGGNAPGGGGNASPGGGVEGAGN